MTNTETKHSVQMAAIGREVSPIPTPAEALNTSKDFMMWGEDNAFPEYLFNLYKTTTDLKTCVDGLSDFVAGNKVTMNVAQGYINADKLNRRDNAFETIQALARDAALYGGFAFQVLCNGLGKVTEIYHVDFRYLRSNKDNDTFYYSEDWAKRFSRSRAVEYPTFMAKSPVISSIVYVKLDDMATYPMPICMTALKACEIERRIDDFHLNGLENGFSASYIVNFNNGVPTDEEKSEIEAMFNRKFAGSANAGRIVFSWNEGKEHAATISKMDLQDFGERYNSLAKWSRQNIYAAFRANPNLFGISTENLGFSSEEYESAFKLFNRTRVRPIQRRIVESIEKVLGAGAITIQPFSLSDEEETNVQ